MINDCSNNNSMSSTPRAYKSTDVQNYNFKLSSFDHTQINEHFNKTFSNFKRNTDKCFTPRISENSYAIMNNRNDVEINDGSDNNLDNAKDINFKMFKNFEQELTFRPLISKNSIQIMKNKPNYDPKVSTFHRN